LPIQADAKTFLTSILKHDLQTLEIDDWRNEIKNYKIEKPFIEKTDFFSMKNALNIINNETSKNLDNFIFCTDV
jgi:hypothetical protein